MTKREEYAERLRTAREAGQYILVTLRPGYTQLLRELAKSVAEGHNLPHGKKQYNRFSKYVAHRGRYSDGLADIAGHTFQFAILTEAGGSVFDTGYADIQQLYVGGPLRT